MLRFTGDFTKARLVSPSLRGRPLPRVVILRKHQLQSEQQGVFRHLTGLADLHSDEGAVGAGGGGGGGGGGEWRARAPLPPVVSGLTPHASKHVEMELYMAYKADKGLKVGSKKFGKTDPAALCSLLAKELKRLQPAQRPWLSTIIDEAHELRNPFSFWAMGAMLAGARRAGKPLSALCPP